MMEAPPDRGRRAIPRSQAPAWECRCLRSSASSRYVRNCGAVSKSRRAKQSFGDKCVPKLELGNEDQIAHCAITDFRPLLDLPKLEKLMVSTDPTGLEVLRHHPSLRLIAWDKFDGVPCLPAAEFWARYDAQKKAGAKGAWLATQRGDVTLRA